MNEQFNKANYESLSDLILNKSQYLKNVAGTVDWATPESLKVKDLQRPCLLLYNYLRFKYSANLKTVKDYAYKSFENLTTFIELLMDNLNAYNLHEDCFFVLFEDYFSFYVEARKTTTDKEQQDKLKDDLSGALGLIKEDTSKNI
jgi:hypothetical protein